MMGASSFQNVCAELYGFHPGGPNHMWSTHAVICTSHKYTSARVFINLGCINYVITTWVSLIVLCFHDHEPQAKSNAMNDLLINVKSSNCCKLVNWMKVHFGSTVQGVCATFIIAQVKGVNYSGTIQVCWMICIAEAIMILKFAIVYFEFSSTGLMIETFVLVTSISLWMARRFYFYKKRYKCWSSFRCFPCLFVFRCNPLLL